MSKDAQFGIESHEVIPKPQVLLTEKLDLLQVSDHKSQKPSMQPDKPTRLSYCIHAPPETA